MCTFIRTPRIVRIPSFRYLSPSSTFTNISYRKMSSSNSSVTTDNSSSSSSSLTEATVIQNVKEYYGQDLKTNADLKTSACCLGNEETKMVSKLLRNINKEILDRFYGCGSPIPPLLSRMTTLDLGCGTGRDTYVCSQLVGADGLCIGLDMTEEQLETAQQYENEQATKFGYAKPNTMFIHGDIANLKKAGIKDNSIDVIISNCVLNLATSKETVLKEIFRVLKPGGELYFSDVYADRRIPETLQKDKVLWGECLSGALYKNDFKRIMERVGFTKYWIVTSRSMSIDDPEIKTKLGKIKFYSETVRAFKAGPPVTVAKSGSSCSPDRTCISGASTVQELVNEDFGQTVRYNGTIDGYPHAFSIGLGQVFITDQKVPVDGYLAHILSSSRYASAFTVTDAKDHRGFFMNTGGNNGNNNMMIMDSTNDDDGSGNASSCCPPGNTGCC